MSFASWQGADPPTVSFKMAGTTAAPNGKVKGEVVVNFAAGMHAYQNPPTKDYMIPVVVASETKGITLQASYPKGEMKELLGEMCAVYEGRVVIPFTATVPKKEGKYTLKIKVSYQQCNDNACFPPGTVFVTTPVTVKTAGKGSR